MIVRVGRRRRYTTIDNTPIEDSRLSFKALGVLTYLLSRPDSWEANYRQLATLREEREFAVRGALTELEAAGYVQRHREHDAESGQFQWVQVILECPDCTDSHAAETNAWAGGHAADTAAAVTHAAETAPVVKTDRTNTDEQSEPDGSRARADSSSDDDHGDEEPTVDARVSWKVPAVVADAGFLDAAIDLCEHWASRLEVRGVRAYGKGRSKAWVAAMEAILRIDGREPHHVRRVIDWLEDGRDEVAHFWQANVLSPDKLRAKWDTLGQQYRRLKTGGSGQRSDRMAAIADLADEAERKAR